MDRLVFAVAAILFAFVIGRTTAPAAGAKVVTVREVTTAPMPVAVHCPRAEVAEIDEDDPGIEIEDTEVVRRLDEESKRIARTEGGLKGAVNDLKTGEYLVGVTIVASTAAGLSQTVISDERGTYELTNLMPGTYTVTMYYDRSTIEHADVIVASGRVTSLDAKIDSAPTIVDDRITIDRDYVRHDPVRFQDHVDPCATGVTFSSGTTLENTYVIE